MQKSTKEEIKYLERILSENSNSILFARLAETYLQADRVDDAIELCEFGVKKHPAYVTGHFILGKCYLKKKLLDQAEKELKCAITFDPKYIAAHREYGELMAQIGWHTTCELTFQEIMKIDPLNEKAKSRMSEIKKLFIHQPENKIDEPGETQFSIKEMDNSFAANIERIEEEKKEPEIGIEKFDLSNNIQEEKAGAEIIDKFNMGEAIQKEKAEDEIVEKFKLGDTIEKEKADAEIVDEFKLGDSIQEEKTEAEIPENPDEDDASMDLLEDIFRDTSIPELESDELTSDEGTFEADIESKFGGQAEEETPFAETPDKPSPFDQPAYVAPEELHQPQEIEEESSEEKLTPLQEQIKPLEDEPLSPEDLSEQPLWESELEQKPETETEIPAVEKPSFEKQDELVSDLKNIQQGEDSVTDVFGSAPGFLPEEEPADKPLEAPKLESDSAGTPPQGFIEPPQIDDIVESLDKKKEKIVTPTLGEIYTAQHQYSKAINVYEMLLKKEPDNEIYKQKIEYLNKKLEESEED
ncbi:hypothetical protein ISS22_03255 [candidate division KSB1 bacterium]|nr:hypothetical protein [candidate division KSB1 bacterium]